ncbi:MAG: hypothetical protein RLZ10_3138 [Bacteroidota bacterium]|jgi:hypothetical protein
MRIFFVFSLIFLFITSCVKNNPDPAWLEVKEWQLFPNSSLSGEEGELTHNFSDAWVYINDEVIGVFEVPFKIPILKSGPCNIKIFPTIRNNGIAATKKMYPFMEVFEVNAELVQNQTLTINPVTKYKGVTQFWIEDFEDPLNLSIEVDQNTSAIKSTPTSNLNLESFNGNFYGDIQLNAVDSSWIASTQQQLSIQKGREAYLEVDYYNTNSVVTGLIYVKPDNSTVYNPNITLQSQSLENVRWKKMYIDLKELIGFSPNGSNFLQSFIARIDEGKSQSEIKIDNIKVVYFN